MFIGASQLSKDLDVVRYGELAAASVFTGAYVVIDWYQLEKVFGVVGFSCELISILQ